MTIFRRFWLGFTFVLVGYRTSRASATLKKWVIAPFIVGLIILLFGSFFGAIYLGPKAIHILATHLGANVSAHPNSVLFLASSWLLHVVLWLLFLVLYLYFIYVIASIVGMPLYRKLAQKTLEQLGVFQPRRDFGANVRHSAKMVLVALERAVILVVCATVLFSASFVPGLNFFAMFIGFILVAFDMSDYALELEGYRLVRRFLFLLTALPEYLGMALFIALTALVPGLIVLTMLFAVIGATHVVHS